MRINVSVVRWRGLIFTLICCAAASCSDSDNGGSASCPTNGPPSDIRIHVGNAENVPNIHVSITTPHGSCAIDPLPTIVDGGIEFGQALYPLVPGDVISFTAQSPSGGKTGECRVNQEAVTEDAIFVDLFITTTGFVCTSGVDPVD